ncbi:MAG: hypothetical protein MJ178_05025 [Treponemataceae bacterium]|nr:hypothetical protein [Treponemataceae bacterium]
MKHTIKKATVILMALCLTASAFASTINGFGLGMAKTSATLSDATVTADVKTSAMVFNMESETLLIGMVGIGTDASFGKVSDQTLKLNGTATGISMKDSIPFPMYSDVTLGAAIRLPVFPLIHLTGLAGIHMNTNMCETILMTAGIGIKAGVEVSVGPVGVRAGCKYFNDWINVLGFASDTMKAYSVKHTGYTPYASIILKR